MDFRKNNDVEFSVTTVLDVHAFPVEDDFVSVDVVVFIPSLGFSREDPLGLIPESHLRTCFSDFLGGGTVHLLPLTQPNLLSIVPVGNRLFLKYFNDQMDTCLTIEISPMQAFFVFFDLRTPEAFNLYWELDRDFSRVEEYLFEKRKIHE